MIPMAIACPLCEKLLNPPGGEVVWQFQQSVAFLGPWQYYTGYCVLVARAHFTELHQLPVGVRTAFLDEMVILSQAIATAFQPRKMNCESLGNQVPHLHWHLFPRSDADNLKPVWLALDHADHDPKEKLRLQTADLPRAEIIGRLHTTLTQMHAPIA